MTNETKGAKITDTYKPDPRTFGGIISEFDFYGYTSIRSVASKIFSDWKFDDTWNRIANYMIKETGSI